MNEKMIDKLIARGGNRWAKGSYDRIYFDAEVLGLECDFYKSGSVSYAAINGERISNSRATELLRCRSYVDVTTGAIVTGSDVLRDLLTALVESVEAEIAAEELVYETGAPVCDDDHVIVDEAPEFLVVRDTEFCSESVVWKQGGLHSVYRSHDHSSIAEELADGTLASEIKCGVAAWNNILRALVYHYGTNIEE